MGISYTGEISPAPTIDGEFVPAEEWDRATQYTLEDASGNEGPTVYIMNDDKFLYVAFDSTSYNNFVAIHLYHEGAHTPNRIDIPVVNADGTKMWDKLGQDDEGNFGGYARESPCYLFECVKGDRTEFKIPLCSSVPVAEPTVGFLGFSAGDDIQVAFVFVHSAVTYTYPLPATFDGTDPDTYEDLTLTPIS